MINKNKKLIIIVAVLIILSFISGGLLTRNVTSFDPNPEEELKKIEDLKKQNLVMKKRYDELHKEQMENYISYIRDIEQKNKEINILTVKLKNSRVKIDSSLTKIDTLDTNFLLFLN